MKALYEQNQNLLNVMNASKQQTIADTARRLFREHGFAAVSVGGICAEADVSRVTFYKYYSGKNALLQEIVTDRKTASVPNLRRCLHGNATCAKPPKPCSPYKNNRLKNSIPLPSCVTSKKTPIWSWSGFSMS